MISTLGGKLVKVVVDDFWNNVYFAKLHIAVDSQVVAVDSRPSDAVAIALRLGAPLFVNDTVLEAANRPPSEEEPSPGRPRSLGPRGARRPVAEVESENNSGRLGEVRRDHSPYAGV